MKLSPAMARRIAIHAQLLDGRTKLPRGKEGAAQTIERLGYIQVDTITAVQRAHLHTLRLRRPDFIPRWLHALQTEDRRVFEYWGHALSLLPMSDYRFYRPLMQRFRNPQGKWSKERFSRYGHLMQPVLERIRAEGSMTSQDFLPSRSAGRPEGEARNPMKRALELLFWCGELMIGERRKFARVYDLTERVLPAGTDTRMPADDEVGRFLVRRALAAYGIAQEIEIGRHIQIADKAIIADALRQLVDSGEVVSVTLEADHNAVYYALQDVLQKAVRLRKKSPRVHLLSPFDNLIIQRDRVKRLFDFDYTLECYVPAGKRKHGYFVLPILWDEALVGRLDPRADRKSGTLTVHSLLLENTFRPSDLFLDALAAGLRDLARANECDRLAVTKSSPGNLGKDLRRRFKRG